MKVSHSGAPCKYSGNYFDRWVNEAWILCLSVCVKKKDTHTHIHTYTIKKLRDTLNDKASKSAPSLIFLLVLLYCLHSRIP